MRPLIVDGRRVISVSWRPEASGYFPAAWVAAQEGWYYTRPVYEGATRDDAIEALCRGLQLTRDQIVIQDQ